MRSTSPPKSACPGVSTMLMRASCHSTEVTLARMVMPRSRSMSLESMARSATRSFSRNWPDCFSRQSTSVVLPWSTCAMIAMLRRIFVIKACLCLCARDGWGRGLWPAVGRNNDRQSVDVGWQGFRKAETGARIALGFDASQCCGQRPETQGLCSIAQGWLLTLCQIGPRAALATWGRDQNERSRSRARSRRGSKWRSTSASVSLRITRFGP